MTKLRYCRTCILPHTRPNIRFDANGDTTLTAYGLYKVGPDGNPLFEKTVK